MPAPDDPIGAQPPESEVTPTGAPEPAGEVPEKERAEAATGVETTGATPASEAAEPPETPYEYDSYYPYNEDPYSSGGEQPPAAAVAEEPPPAAPQPAKDSGGGSPPEPPDTAGPGDDEEGGMLRMSFLEHLEELRSRILRALAGVGVAFILSLTFANQLWIVVSEPAVDALTKLGLKNPQLYQIAPMEVFNIVWVKLPILSAIFLSSPWILYQVWGFIAPGLYKKERRWAAPFVLSSAGLFILGGIFGYFVAFRFGLVFLLGIGRDIRIAPIVSVSEYFDLFVNVMLGVGLVFELPVLIFFLTLLRIASPSFLFRHSRYAILVIAILAAIVTPTPDVFNMVLFCVPMWLLYFVGLFAGYLLVLHREHRRFPWKKVLYPLLMLLIALAGALLLAVTKYGYKLVLTWPFLKR